MQHVPYSELDSTERLTRPAATPDRLQFHHFEGGADASFSPQPFIPLEAVQEGDEQVVAARLPSVRNVVDLDPLSHFPSVRSVVVATEVRARTVLPSIRELLLDYGVRLPDPETLRNLPHLESLWARWAPSNQGLDLTTLPRGSLRFLGISRQLLGPSSGLAPMTCLGGFVELRRLVLRECLRSDSVASLASLTRLVSLDADASGGWPKLASCTSLLSVSAYRPKLDDFRRLESWGRLRQLTVSMGPLKTIDGIEAFRALHDLTLMALRVDDLAPLAGLPELEHVRLLDLPGLSDISVLGTLPALRSLKVRGGQQRNQQLHIASLRPLRDCSRLEYIALEDVHVQDGSLAVLSDLPSLRTIELRGLPSEQTTRLRASRPDLEFKIFDPLPSRPVVAVGEVDISPPSPGSSRWSIFQDLSDLLRQPTNPAAEELLRLALVGVDRALLDRLEFDSEAGAVGIIARSEADIRAVATIINELALSVAREGDSG